jgi:hypothetical protein
MSYRGKTWQDIAALDEHLTVFLKLDEALERFLEDFGFSLHEAYKIRTDSGSVDRQSRAQISAAVDSLGGSLSSLESRYTDPDDGRSVGITTQPFPAFPLYRIACALNVHGDDETETNGRFDTLRNRMDAEIKRQFPPSTAAEPVTAPPAAAPPSANAPSANAPGAGGFKQWVNGVLRHPTGSQIVGALVVAGLIALIGVLSKVLGG